MIEFSATVDRASFDRTINGLKAFDKARGLTVKFIAHDAMRAWVKDMMKYTAPWANGTPGTGLKQRGAGHAAVVFDLLGGRRAAGAKTIGAFGVIDEAKIGRTFDDKLSGHPIVVLKSGAVFGVDRALFRPDASQDEMHKHHVSLRGKNGRVSQAGSRDRKVGRWKFINKMFVRKPVLESYIESVKARVGSLKAGWLPALYHYAALSNGSVGRIPQWISGQAIRAGSFGGNMSDRGDGSIFSVNTAHHSRAIRRDTVLYAQKKQERSMKAFGEKRVQRLCDQFNAGQRPVAQTKAAA